MLEPIAPEHTLSENTSLTVQTEQPATAKINLLDLNRQQLREFSPTWVKNLSAPIR